MHLHSKWEFSKISRPVYIPTKSDVNIFLAKEWNAINKWSIILKPNLSNKIKQDFFQSVAVSLLLYRCTIWTLSKGIEKKLNENYTKTNPRSNTPQNSDCTATCLLSHKPCEWRSKDELISHVLLWTPAHGHASVVADQQRLTSVLCGHKMQSRRPTSSNGW